MATKGPAAPCGRSSPTSDLTWLKFRQKLIFLFSLSCFRERILEEAPYNIVEFTGDENAKLRSRLYRKPGKERVMRRRRLKDILSFRDRLEQEAKALKDEARELQPGRKRETLLWKARQLEAAVRITGLLTSPGLSPRT